MPKDYHSKRRLEEAREELARKKKPKAVGSRVQGPDAQYNTGMMGKQPVSVYPALKVRV